MVILISSVVPTTLFAAFNEQINYQGKLTNSAGSPVSNGTYNMEFKLYVNNSTTTALWTETLTGANKVTVTNGLFSIMLGSTTPFTGVDFDQTLYLGVNIGGTSTPSWDGEMTPRKILGAVPAAFIAKNAKLFDGNSVGNFIKAGVNATNTTSTFVTFTQNGTGNIAEFIATSSRPALVVTGGIGSVGIGTSTPIATLNVQGQGGTNPFVVSSSTGASMITLLQNGNLGVGTSTPGALVDVWGDLRVATGSVPLFYASTSLNRVAIGTTSLTSLLNVGGTTTTQVLTAGKYSDGYRSVPLSRLYRDNAYRTFDQRNAMIATTTPHVPGNYYLATSTTAFLGFTDISGVKYYPRNNTLLLNKNTNAAQTIYELTLDGRLLRTVSLPGFSDPEALDVMYDNILVIGEENTIGTSTGSKLVIIELPDNATSINRNNGTVIDLSGTIPIDNQSVEGVAYDPHRDVFYVAEENLGTDANIFRVTRDGTITTIWNPDTTTMSNLNIGDFSDLYYDYNTDHLFVAVDQCYNQSNGLAGCDQILEIDLNGNVIDRIHAPNGFNQVEGIGFSPDGESMYIVGEPGMFAWYKFQDRADKLYGYQSSSSTPLTLGIGTTTPQGSFTVQGRAGVNPFIVASSTGTHFLTLLQNGNFGIGSSTPIAGLTIQGTSLQGSTSTPLVDFASSSGASIFRIALNNVGIGSTSPSAKLSINSDAGSTNDAPFAIAAYGGTGGSSNGVGGGFIFRAGTGGGSNGTGGAFTVVTGTGGSSGGAGGAISLTAGAAGSSGSGLGGAVTITGGIGSASGGTAGGAVTITTGQGGSSSGTAGAGGLLSILGGNAGTGSSAGQGGSIAITGGNGNTISSGTGASGGTITITGGTGTIVTSGTPGAGGLLTLVGGSAGTGGSGGAAGGNVFIAGGLGRNATGTVGDVILGMSDASSQRGNVGIGSSTPIARLAVTGTSSLANIFTVASSSNATFFTVYRGGEVGIGSSTPNAKLSILNTSSDRGVEISQAGSSNNRFLRFTDTSASGVSLDFVNRANDVVGAFGLFDTVSTNYRFISTSNGYFAVGTTSPRSLLTAFGDLFLEGSSRYINFGTAATGTSGYGLRDNGGAIEYKDSGGSWIAFNSISGGPGGSSAFTIGNGFIYNATTTDLVGIGTTSPLSKLSVYGDLFLEGSSRYINFGVSTGTDGYGLRDNAGTIQFKNLAGSWQNVGTGGSGSPGGNNTAVQFNSGGTFGGDELTFNWNNTLKRLGIGSSTPVATLSVQGSSTSDTIFAVASSTGTQYLTVLSNGRVGVGSSSPAYAFSVTGTSSADYLVVGGGTPLANSIAHFGADVNSYAQVNIQNRNAGTSASSDLVLTSDNGNDSRYYIDLGVNSSGYNNAAYSITGANDGYLYTSDGALAIGTASTTNTNAVLKFHTGGTLAANERMRITSTGNVGIGTTSPAEKLHVAGNILIGAQADSAPTWTKRSDTTAGTITSGGTSSIGSTTAMAVFNGSLYIGTTKANSAEVYRYNGGTSWTQVSSTTAGAFGTSTTVNIDGVSSMAVWNGNLYIGTEESASAEVYRYNGNSSWTKISSSTAGVIGGNSTTTAINKISAMTVHGGYLYIGTAKSASAEIARYNGPLPNHKQTWTKVNALPNVAGTIGTETLVNEVGSLTSFQGYLFAGTNKSNDAGLHRYDGQGVSGTGWTSIIATGQFDGTNNYGATDFGAIHDAVTSMAVYAGRLYIGLWDTGTGARVVKWDGSLTAGANFHYVSSSTVAIGGIIAEDTGSQTGIDRVTSMAVYNDDLFIGTADTTGIGQVYKIDQGSTWSLVSSTTAGTISTGVGATTGINGVTSLQVYNNNLWVGTEKASASEVYSFNIAEAESYDLMFHASSDQADGEYNGFLNTAFIEFQAEETGYNSAGNQNTGKFNFSHGLNTITGAYDLAEDYPTRDDMLGVADLVTLDTREKGLVKRSTGKGDRNVIGIYSENPALRLSQKDATIDGARAVPIALAGRVPVNVTIENGPIAIGDYLTASIEPGKAAKATTPGRVIGRALSPYNGEGEARVTVFIGMETIGWNEIQRAQTDVASLDNDQMETPDSFEAYVERINEGVSDIALAMISRLENTTLLVANKIVALVANIKEAFIATLTILPDGNIVLPSGDDQIAGVGSILGGYREVFVKNSQIDGRSIISITPTSPTEVPLYVSEKRPGEGFVVQMSKVTPDTISFTWVIFKTYEKMGNVIASSTDSVGSTTETTIVNVNGEAVTNSIVNDPVSSNGEPVTSPTDNTVINTDGHSSSTEPASSGGAEVFTPVTDPVSSGGSSGEQTVTSEGGATTSGWETSSNTVTSEPGQTVTPETPPAPAPAPEPAPTPAPEAPAPEPAPVASPSE